MRLIDADTLISELEKDEKLFDKEAEDARNNPSEYDECYSIAMWMRAKGIRDAIIEVYDAPTICLCKDCRKYKYDWCHKFANVVKPDDFCSYAERREDDE